MFTRSDFWIGLVVGTIAGAFGYKLMSEQAARSTTPLLPIQPGSVPAEPPLEELLRQKERLEDLIAEKQQGAVNG